MFDVAQKVARHRLFRKAAMVAIVLPVGLLAACAHEEVAVAPPQPAAYQPPPPPPPPAPAPVIGERG